VVLVMGRKEIRRSTQLDNKDGVEEIHSYIDRLSPEDHSRGLRTERRKATPDEVAGGGGKAEVWRWIMLGVSSNTKEIDKRETHYLERNGIIIMRIYVKSGRKKRRLENGKKKEELGSRKEVQLNTT